MCPPAGDGPVLSPRCQPWWCHCCPGEQTGPAAAAGAAAAAVVPLLRAGRFYLEQTPEEQHVCGHGLTVLGTDVRRNRASPARNALGAVGCSVGSRPGGAGLWLCCHSAASQLCAEHRARTSNPCHENHGISGGGPPEGCPGALLGQEGLMGYRQKGEGDTGAACKGQRWGEMLWHIHPQLLSPGLTLQSPFGEYFVTARVKYKWEQSNTVCPSTPA